MLFEITYKMHIDPHISRSSPPPVLLTVVHMTLRRWTERFVATVDDMLVRAAVFDGEETATSRGGGGGGGRGVGVEDADYSSSHPVSEAPTWKEQEGYQGMDSPLADGTPGPPSSTQLIIGYSDGSVAGSTGSSSSTLLGRPFWVQNVQPQPSKQQHPSSGKPDQRQRQHSHHHRPTAGLRVNRISLGKIVWGVELLDPGAYARWTQHDWIGSVLQLYR